MVSSNSKLGIPHPATQPEDIELVDALFKISRKSPKLVRSSTYAAPAEPELTVRSWKMNEFKYYDVPSPFPTLARGVFTMEVEGGEQRIVARGYDKFFNIGEVPWTTWDALKTHTAPPYTLSLKSNGCIIFIGALTPSKLLITSKHSVGAVGNAEKSHAQAGEEWLRKYLQDKGRTEAEFAKVLWDNNWTAVAELCDDSFEEHVLPYPPHLTGLHLHGLNTCTKAFHTLPHSTIDAFAAEWGFIKTESLTLNSIEEVQKFTDEVSKTQHWNGQAVEGFVVRTSVTDGSTAGKGGGGGGRSPYAPGSTFFFKVKFDEPYMMYRDWREVTKILLSAYQKGSKVAGALESCIPKNKTKRPETQVYAKWVIGEILRDPKSFKDYSKGKGIIATRERFLAWLEGEGGKKAAEGGEEGSTSATTANTTLEKENEEVKSQAGKTIIVPVAIPGCGKTAVAVALAHIFGFGHTQSDDVHVKKAAPVFLKNVENLLKKYDVVIADKNNHLYQHRTALRDLAHKTHPPARLVALYWDIPSHPQSTIHRICGDRILSRGSNHQSLRADASSKSRPHEDVVWRFISQSEDLTPAEVDDIVEMELEEDLESAVRRAVDGVCRVLGVERPEEGRVEEGIKKALGYEVKDKDKEEDEKGKKAKKKDAAPRYFGILPEVNLEEVLGNVFTEGESYSMWMHLKQMKRIAKRPHVTVVHSKSLPGEIELWERCMEVHAAVDPPMFELTLGSVVWDERVMAVTVDEMRVVGGSGADQSQVGTQFVERLGEEVRKRLHVTVGTRDDEVPPVEAKALVESWRAGKTDGIESKVISGEVKVRGRVKGLMS
ncbi:hypothetical protein GYMLUDRAFT_178440 [Collybiopsis luxurians FD-317 M1]|uniref:tRNA ligase n=1 Tax=Collybiopsis luxurians FD-317 M1 TaxID=944289 RepID=A0A0D0CFP1_9AGAR|nr:hypothetical protein GYMLUDRAFT_178440 [Collybiopsis luxurians FD-317 M1]